MRIAHLLATLMCLTPVASGIAQESEQGRQGWFWYVDPAEQALPEDLAIEDAGHQRETGYSTSWIRENLPKLRDAAIDDPSPTNVRAYLYVQRLAMDRASAFQASVSFVTSADPYLDQVARFPTSEGGAKIGGSQAESAKQETLFALSQQTGIWFFYRSDCRYCHAMVPVLLNLQRQFGFTIMPVSLDGLPLDARLPNFSVDRGQASALGIEVTPSFFLVKPPDLTNVVPIAQGFVSQTDFEERIIRMAYFHGWISEQQYASTRIANPLLLNTPNAADQTMDPAAIVRQLRPGPAMGASTSVHLPPPR